MNKERICLLAVSVICILGCVVISAYNAYEAVGSNGLLISTQDYNHSMVVSVSDSPGNSGNAEGTININTATAEELSDFLPGIGPKKAEAIVSYRSLSGGFGSVDELLNVDGIGKATLDKIRPYCRVKD